MKPYYAYDEDAFMQLLKYVMTENFDRLESEFTQWLDENEPLVDGHAYEDGPEYVRTYIREMFVDEYAYEFRAEMIDMFDTELDLNRYDSVWTFMDEHDDYFADRYLRWLKDNTDGHGIGYRTPDVGMLWYEFLTDYGTRNVDKILDMMKEADE